MNRRRPSVDTAAERAMKATTSRHIHLFYPFACWLGLWPLGAAGWLVWGTGDRSGLPWVVIGLTLSAVVLTALVAHIARTRHNQLHLDLAHSVTTVALSAVFLISAVIAGPWTHPLLDLWGFGGITLASTWSIRMFMEARDKQAHTDGRPSRRSAAAALMAAHGLDIDAEVVAATPDRIDIAFDTTDSPDELLPEDVAARGKHVAVSLGVPARGVSVAADAEHAGRGTMRIVRRDILRDPLPWPGPSHPGGTPFDPIVMGVYQDGVLVEKTIADETGARHELTQGMPGSGKSNGARIELCELMTREETFLIAIDVVKKTQVLGILAEGLGLLLTETTTARAFVRRLRKLVAGRTDYLAAKNLDSWRPGCGLSFLVLLIEEASELDVSEKEMEALSKAARSGGIRLKWSLQRSTHTQVSTVLRAMLGGASVYGCSDAEGDNAIPDEVRDAGADPNQWRDEWPGCNYLIVKGIPFARKVTPLRDYEADRGQMAAHSAYWGPRMDPLDPVTAGLLGDLWTKRVPPVEVVRRAKAAALDTEVPAAVPQPDASVPVDGELDDDADQAPTDEELGVTTEDLNPTMQVDASKPLPELKGNIPFSAEQAVARGPMTEVEVTEARQIVADRIAAAERDGRQEIRPTDFADLYASEPKLRSRAWFRKELQRQVELGRLRFDHDEKVYIIQPDPNMIAV